MSDRIEKLFARCRAENRRALIVYQTMGFPDCETSLRLSDHLIGQGADMIELGVPFSDPTADGPVIQTAGNLALKNGATLLKILDVAAELRRRHPETPLVLFSYYNVLLNCGLEKLTAKLAEIGVDGILAVDLPFEERGELLPLCRKHDLALIPLLSPATGSERAAKITKGMKGFVYCITVRGITGVRDHLPPELAAELEDFKRAAAPLPVAAGFGISTPEMARDAGRIADAVVVGSAAVKLMLDAETPETGISSCGEFIAKLAAALRCSER